MGCKRFGTILILMLLGWSVGRPHAEPSICDIRDPLQIKRQSGVVLVALKDLESDILRLGDCNPSDIEVQKMIANLQDQVRKLAAAASDNR